MKKLGLFLAACWIGISSCAAQSRTEYVAPENTQFRVVGYVPGYRDLDAVPDRTLAQLDIACYAFATIDSTGIPRVANEKQLARFVRRAHRLGVKVMLSFNGKHARFAQMASDDRQRKAFVDEIWRLVQKYHMDGVDNDWEFPRTTDGTAESNLALMKDLARLCRGGEKQYLLTMAVTSGLYPGNRSDAISDELVALVDWLNVMVYGNFPRHVLISSIPRIRCWRPATTTGSSAGGWIPASSSPGCRCTVWRPDFPRGPRRPPMPRSCGKMVRRPWFAIRPGW